MTPSRRGIKTGSASESRRREELRFFQLDSFFMVGRKNRSCAVCDSAHSAIRDVCCFLDGGFSCKYGSRKVGNEQRPAPACFSLAQRFELGVIISQSQLVSSRCPTATWTTASGRVDPVCRCRTTESLAGNQAKADLAGKSAECSVF